MMSVKNNLISDAVGNASWGENIKTYFLDPFVSIVRVMSNNEHELPNSALVIPATLPSRLIISVGYRMTNLCPPIGTCDGRSRFFLRLNDSPFQSTGLVTVKNIGAGHVGASLTNFILDVPAGTHQLTFFTEKSTFDGSVNYKATLAYLTVMVLPL